MPFVNGDLKAGFLAQAWPWTALRRNFALYPVATRCPDCCRALLGVSQKLRVKSQRPREYFLSFLPRADFPHFSGNLDHHAAGTNSRTKPQYARVRTISPPAPNSLPEHFRQSFLCRMVPALASPRRRQLPARHLRKGCPLVAKSQIVSGMVCESPALCRMRSHNPADLLYVA